MPPKQDPARTWATLYNDLRAKYVALVERLNQTNRVLVQNRAAFRRLLNNYYRLKKNYLVLRKHSTAKVMELIDRIANDHYQVVFDENRTLLKVSEEFLNEVEMTQDEFGRSMYVDILFERYLPPPDRRRDSLDVPAFRFPILLKSYETDSGSIHPFAHFVVSGMVACEKKGGPYLYFLNIENISSAVELDYFQKTDSLIISLSISNHNLTAAKKTIEMHKRMLISMTCSLVGEYSRETSDHLTKMEQLTTWLAQECKVQGLITVENYDLEEYIKDISYTSVLHDIGKMAIPMEILAKDQALTEAERQIVRGHPTIGASYIQRIIDMFKNDPQFSSYCGFLTIPYQICLYHHERWDGTGYPEGLSGQSIPTPARIVAVADTYDALRGNRIYNHNPKSHGEAAAIIRAESGKQFDPKVVAAFESIAFKFETLY